MGAAAELGREIAHPHHADLVAVLLAKERLCAFLLCLFDAHDLGLDRMCRPNLTVHKHLDLLHLFLGERRKVREVKAQSVRTHKAARLVHMIAEHLAECLVQEMRAGVVLRRILAVCRIDRKRHSLADPEHAGEYLTGMTDLAAL